MSRLRGRGGAVAPEPEPGAAVEFNMGAKTRQGFGGFQTSETASSALTGTTYFVVDDMGCIVPANSSAATYGGAWTPPVSSGQVEFTGASGQLYRCTIVASAAHVAARTTTTGGVNQDGSSVSAPGGGNAIDYQLTAMIDRSTWVARGDTIYMRDGHLNPSGALMYFRPLAAASYSGSGYITIRSDTVDTSVDSDGYKNRRHGGKIGRLYYVPATGAQAIRFEDLHFYMNANAADETGLWVGQNGADFSGVQFHNCGFENGASVTAIEDRGGILSGGKSTSVTSCTFRNLGFGVRVQGNGLGTSPTVEDCYFRKIRDADAIQIGSNNFDWSIQRNVLIDIRPTGLGHCDFLQFLGLSGGASGAMGIVAENIMWDAQSQGIFVTDHVSGSFTSGTIRHNIMQMTGGNAILGQNINNLTIAYNIALGDTAGGSSNGSLGVGIRDTLDNGTGSSTGAADTITVKHNVANAFSYANSLAATNVTKTPSTQTVLARSLSAYQAVFPNYTATLASPSEANLKAMFVPSSGGYSTLASGGTYKPDGNLNDAA